jgi:hypothetical protein
MIAFSRFYSIPRPMPFRATCTRLPEMRAT